MDLQSRIKIKSTAEEIIANYALKAPFNVISLAKSFGIDVVVAQSNEILDAIEKKVDLVNLIGYFDRQSKIFYIPKSANGSISRQRFTIAHELGHYILGHSNQFRVVNKNDIYDYHQQKEEVEANYFASYLLIPDKDLISRLSVIKFFRVDELRISYLAKVFMVSADAMRIRLKTFFEENPQYV